MFLLLSVAFPCASCSTTLCTHGVPRRRGVIRASGVAANISSDVGNMADHGGGDAGAVAGQGEDGGGTSTAAESGEAGGEEHEARGGDKACAA